AARAEQLSLMAAMAHQKRTDPRIGEMLGKLDGTVKKPEDAANVREVRRSYDRAVKVPEELVRRIAKVPTIAKDAWGKARAEDNFGAFAPHLSEILELKREVADRIGWKVERYDALLDEYEPGMTTAEVASVFDSLREPLAEFVMQLGAAR